jgi:UPF0271 protein
VGIDLNADLGEGFGVWTIGDDDALLDVITSANIACGFHAGDPHIMVRTCAHATQRGVAIGAQVGYRDLAGFGRRRIDIDADRLYADVLYQLGALYACAVAAGSSVRYVKPHGALYHAAADDAAQAGAIVDAVSAFDAGLPVLGLAGSKLQAAAEGAGVPFVSEAFADRRYLSTGRLVPRTAADAVIHDQAAVTERVLRMARENMVRAVDGADIHVRADSICLHGDTPDAAALARAVRAALTEAGVELRAFAR